MAKLRLGVIGAGSWAIASHLPNIARRRDDVEFVAVSRLGSAPLARVRDQFGLAVASEDYRDVLRAGIDICVVSSPARLHYEHAKAALEAGAHVLVEKPMTIDSQQAWDLVRTATRLGRHGVVAFGWNYKPMIRRAKRLMDTGAGGGIGEIEHIAIHMASSTRDLLLNEGVYPDAAPEMVPDAVTWTDPAFSGGGYGQAQLSHALGLALWLTDVRGRDVFAFTSPHLAAIELHDAVALRFDNGAIGTMSGGSVQRNADGDKHQLDVRAIGAGGQLHVDVEREVVRRFRPPHDDVNLEFQPDEGRYDCVGPVDTLIDLALGHEVENCSPLGLGARTVEILDAVYRSARSGVVEIIAAS